MQISNISVSRKSVWDQCTQLYKYQYHLKLPSLEPEPFYFTYGSTIHKIAEEFVKAKGKKTLGRVALDVLEGKIPIKEGEDGSPIYAPSLPPEYKKRLPDHLKYLAKITDKIGMGGEVEHVFLFDLDPPNNRLVKGYIDRIISKDDNYFILDYKTSKKGLYRKTRGNITSDLQLQTYARVVQTEKNVPASKIYSALYYLEGGDLIGAKFSDQTLLNAEKSLLYTYKEIENTPEDKAWGNVGKWCSRCNYRKMCPFYRMS
jgi:RecB family exonuclease